VEIRRLTTYGCVLVVIWLTCATASGQAREFVRHVTMLQPGYHGHYPFAVDKRDIIWIDSTIKITAPLRSNGGDIILFANEIDVEAPIDSRVFIQHDMGDIQFPHADIGDIDHFLYKSPQKAQPFLSLYRDYYLHSPDLPDQSTETAFPELPSGETRLSANGQAIQVMQGTPPPDADVDFSEIRSGNIYIFAHKIIVPDQLKKGIPRSERFECSSSPTPYQVAPIVSSGIRGGRGGLGSLPICFLDSTVQVSGSGIDLSGFYQQQWPYSCHYKRPELFRQEGGLNAPGGRGGDAGDISIHVVNDTASDFSSQRKSLLAATDARAGQPGNSEKLQTSSLMGDPKATESRCSLHSLGSFDPSQPGRPGLVAVDSINSSTAIIALASVLRSKDAQVDYDFTELAQRSKSDANIRSLLPSDSLTDYLELSLEESELRVLQDFEGIAKNLRVPSGGYNLPILAKATEQSLASASLSDRQKALLREVALFDDRSGNRLYAYLFNSGGLFNSYSVNPISDYNLSAIRLDLNETNKKLSEIKSQLVTVNATLFRELSYEQQRDMQEDIERIKAELDQAKATAQSGGLGDIVAAIADVMASFGGLGDALSKLFASKKSKDPTEDLRKVGSQFKSGFDSSNKLSLILRGTPNIAALNQALEDAMIDYQKFLGKVKDIEQRYLDEENHELFYALEKRQTAFSRLSTRSVLFHDILRAAIITYLIDPSKKPEYLMNNFEAIETLLRDFPREEPRFMISPMPTTCQPPNKDEELLSCIQIKAGTKEQLVEGVFSVDQGQATLPLYRIAPSNVSRRLPVFGIKPKISAVKASAH